MKGHFVEPNPLNPTMVSAIKFFSRKGGYLFISSLFLWCDEERSYLTGRFDFEYKGSSALTNKGFKAINQHKGLCFNSIDKLFECGAEFIEINAAPDKLHKRMGLYERILKQRYKISSKLEDVLFLENN